MPALSRAVASSSYSSQHLCLNSVASAAQSKMSDSCSIEFDQLKRFAPQVFPSG